MGNKRKGLPIFEEHWLFVFDVNQPKVALGEVFKVINMEI